MELPPHGMNCQEIVSWIQQKTKKSMKIALTFGETVLLRDSSTMWNKLKKNFGNLPDTL